MYIDPNDPSRGMEPEVNEATAKLKGLLGIGPSSPAPTTTTTVSVNEAESTDSTDSAKAKDAGANKGKKRNNRKKKAKEQPEQQSQQPQPVVLLSKNPKAGKSTPQNSNAKKGKKKNKKKDNEKDSQNFAWSAFQSSPDASKLPIPAFSSPTPSKEQVTIDGDGAFPALLDKSSEAPSVPEIMNVPKAQDVEDQMIAETKKVVANETAQSEKQSKELPDSVAAEKDLEKEDSPSNVPVSKTGINLAALAAKPESSTTTATDLTTPATSEPRLAYQNQLSPMPRTMPHHSYQSAPYPQQSQFPPPPPPGYVTIQVQVPMVLGPGRQMVVSSPAGYPVRVVVPEGIPPGMVIPVHVPVAPPMHMLPPQNPSPYGGYYHPR